MGKNECLESQMFYKHGYICYLRGDFGADISSYCVYLCGNE